MGGAVLTQTDGIVGEHVDHQAAAVVEQVVEGGGHGVLAYAEVQVVVLLSALLEAALLFDLRAVLSH